MSMMNSNETATICGNCGVKIPRGQVIWQDGVALCGQCIQLNGTCHFCGNRFTCEFETSTSPIPKVKHVRQQQAPGMFFEGQIMNPERIAATCAKGCTCFDRETNGCFQQEYGVCAKYIYGGPKV